MDCLPCKSWLQRSPLSRLSPSRITIRGGLRLVSGHDVLRPCHVRIDLLDGNPALTRRHLPARARWSA